MATREVVSELAKAETQETGVGPVEGGSAAAAQSLLDKQRNLSAKIDEIVNKSPEDITQHDASELQSRQDRVLGTDARTPGSLAARIQQQADHNDTTKAAEENGAEEA